MGGNSTKPSTGGAGKTDIADAIGDVEVTYVGREGSPKIQLKQLWADGPVVLVLFRRFGCSLCQMGAANINSLAPHFADKGYKIVGISTSMLGIKPFTEQGIFSRGEILLDPSKRTFDLLKLPTVGITTRFTAAMKALWKKAEDLGYGNNHRGDLTLLGAHFIIGKGGVTQYAHFQLPFDMEPDVDAMTAAAGLTKPPGGWITYPSAATITHGNYNFKAA